MNFILFFLGIFALFSGKNEISDYSVSFDSGKVIFSWDSRQSLDVYKTSPNGDFQKVGTVSGKTYITDDAGYYTSDKTYLTSFIGGKIIL